MTKPMLKKALFFVLLSFTGANSLVFMFSGLMLVFTASGRYLFLAEAGILLCCFTGIIFMAKQPDSRMSGKELLQKVAFSFLNIIMTSIFCLVYFFVFLFITTSSYGKGGWGGDTPEIICGLVFLAIWFLLFSVQVMLTIRTQPKNISHMIYIVFLVLQWSSFVAIFLGVISTWYFYHTAGALGYVAMLLWDILLLAIYSFLKSMSRKALKSVRDWDSHIILHQQKREALKNAENVYVRCPFCCEEILEGARKCRHCGSAIE